MNKKLLIGIAINALLVGYGISKRYLKDIEDFRNYDSVFITIVQILLIAAVVGVMRKNWHDKIYRLFTFILFFILVLNLMSRILE